MVNIKHKDFLGAVPIMPCEKSMWIMGLRIYGERRTQIPPSSSATMGPCQRSRIDRVYTDIYTDIKIANNTKINHIMVPFTDHYNIISIDRLPSKTKIGKDSWYFNNSLLCEPEVSSATRLFFFYLKHRKSKWYCSGTPAFKI